MSMMWYRSVACILCIGHVHVYVYRLFCGGMCGVCVCANNDGEREPCLGFIQMGFHDDA